MKKSLPIRISKPTSQSATGIKTDLDDFKMPTTPHPSLRNARKVSPDLSALLQADNDNDANNDEEHGISHQLTDSMSMSIPASSITVAGDNIDDLTAEAMSDPIGAVKMVATHLKQLSDGADARDHYKPALSFLSQQLSGAVAGLVMVAGKKRAFKEDDSDEDQDMEDEEDSETKEQERIRSKRAQTVGEFGRQREGKAMRRK